MDPGEFGFDGTDGARIFADGSGSAGLPGRVDVFTPVTSRGIVSQFGTEITGPDDLAMADALVFAYGEDEVVNEGDAVSFGLAVFGRRDVTIDVNWMIEVTAGFGAFDVAPSQALGGVTRFDSTKTSELITIETALDPVADDGEAFRLRILEATSLTDGKSVAVGTSTTPAVIISDVPPSGEVSGSLAFEFLAS